MLLSAFKGFAFYSIKKKKESLMWGEISFIYASEKNSKKKKKSVSLANAFNDSFPIHRKILTSCFAFG